MLKDKQELTDEEQVALGLFLIGDGYMKGIYLEKDEKKAFRFFQDSAIKYNYTDAENALGFCYLNGVELNKMNKKVLLGSKRQPIKMIK
jgi:TPR repeat protein